MTRDAPTSSYVQADDRTIRRLLWLTAFAFVLHEAEEWNLASWLQMHFEPAPPFSDRDARTLLVLFSALGFGFVALCLRFLSLRAAVRVLLPFLVAILLGNALTHVVWLFSFQAYAPGVATSLVLLIPLIAWVTIRSIATGLVPLGTVAVLTAIALVQPVFAAFAGSRLTGGQLALQALGSRLAAALWGGG